MTTGKGSCGKAPAGWRCSREHEHEGPCAAHQVVDTKATYIKCDTYTDYESGFGLYKEQREAIGKWIKEHNAAKHIPAGRSFRYAGAIGGVYTYEFTSTTLGMCVHVRCSCGESIDVSDYDQW